MFRSFGAMLLPMTLFAIPAAAARAANPCMAHAVSTADIENCQQAALAAANRELNAVYERIIAELRPAGQQRLRLEERAWIGSRDRTCKVAVGTGTSGAIGSGDCLVRQTRGRTQVLSEMGTR